MSLEPFEDKLYIVKVQVPVTGAELASVSARVSSELGIPTAQLEQLLSEEFGSITRPISRENADEIVEVLRKAGVQSLATVVASSPTGDLSGSTNTFQAARNNESRSPVRAWIRTIAILILLLLILSLIILRSIW